MSDRFPSYVVAVAGTSGAGKTRLVRAVARVLEDAAALFFDDYEATSTYPEDWTAWWRAGGDLDAVQTPVLAADLRALRDGVPINDARSGLPIDPAAFVVVDEPFGRARTEVRDLVDFVACLDVPRDPEDLALEVVNAVRSRRAPGLLKPHRCA